MEVFEKLKIKKFIPALIIFGLLLFITSYHTSSLSENSKKFRNGNLWEYNKDNITISGDGNDLKKIDVTSGTNEKLYTGNKFVIFDYNITSNNTVSGNLTFVISDVGIMSDDKSLEIWHINDNSVEQVNSSINVSEGKVEFNASELGEYIAVSNVATVDLAKGSIIVTDSKLNGVRQDGKTAEFALDIQDKKYRISQSNNKTRVNNIIKFETSKDYENNKTIILDGINTYSYIKIPGETNTILLTLQLRSVNQVSRIEYGTGRHDRDTEQTTNNDNSRLTIENYDKSDEYSGELYIPYKMDSRAQELAYVSVSRNDDGIGPAWAIAGIGGNIQENTTGLTISGGTLRVLVQNQNGATAIGSGGNADAQISITGGNITAICSSTGAAIGGGIGWVSRGGSADVSITGGKVYAENIGYYTRSNVDYGGVAIGSGSSKDWYGSNASVKIGGNSQVTAYARYGNAIGSGNSYDSEAANAKIIIDGNSRVTTNALGGGTSKNNQGGSAEVTIKDNSIVDCVEYSKITNKWDSSSENILNVYGIGGGSSSGTFDGGTATVNILGGTLKCNGGNIGGGSATGSGNGGTAIIDISGGTIQSNNIGGGYSKTYGYASSNVTITGGSVNSSISSQPTNGSENVYLTRATLYSMDAAMTNHAIKSLSGTKLTTNYGLNNVKTDENGTLYIWSPSASVITSANDGSIDYDGSIVSKTSGILQYNSSKKFFSAKISYNKDVKLYTDEKLTSEFSGSLMVPSNTDTSFYVQAEKYNSDNYYDINLYMSDGNTMKKISPSSVDNENGVYKYTVNITSDNYIWIESIKDNKEKKLSIDLSFGNAVIESGSKDSTNKLKVNGYSLDNYDGDFYLTSASLGVTNNLIVKSGSSTITTNSLVLSSNNSGIEIENGEVNLYSSASNDSIISTDNPAIYLKKDSSLNIYDTTDGSLELTTKKENTSAIDGEGSVVINKKDGFLILNSGEGATSIRADDYTYNAENKISNSILPYTITFANREFVGFISSYSGTNKIYDSSYKHTTTSNSSFKAIGVEYIKYGDEVITHSIVNDNLVFNISNIDEDKVLTTHVKNGNSLLENNTNYVWQQNTTTGVLTINGEAITEHLITAFVEEEELAIVVDAVDKTYNYDGSNHSIDVRVVFPTIGVKLEYCTDSDCFLEDGSKNTSANWTSDKPSLSTVGVHNISWNASSPGYRDKGGVNTLTINKADNYFTSGGVMIESISKGDTLNPRATSKYGTPYFEYSSTYTGGYTTTPPTDAGIYYVRAVVDETNEYKGIVSDAVAFFIEDPTVYTLGINSWDKINTLGAQKSTTVKASTNGEASMLMNFNYVPDTKNGNYISFVFSNNLPVGTVLSLVDFTNDDNYEVYYYVVEKETNTIYSNQFMQIGTSTKKSFEIGESGVVKNILYQLNIKYSEDVSSSTLRIVKNVDNKDLTLITPISITNTSRITENINNSTVTMSDNNHVATISTTINNLNEFTNYTNVLNVSLYENDGVTKKIFTPSTSVKINGTDSYINGNIATSNNIVNGSNKIEITGLEEGTYKVKLSISYIKNNLYNIMLPMKEKTKDLQTISFEVDKYPRYALKVSTNNLKDRGVYVKEKDKTVKFNLKYKAEVDNPKFNLVIKKNNEVINNWNYKLNDSIVNTSSLENNISTSSLNLTIPKNTTPGTYKLYFTLGDKTIKYTIVVLEDELSDVSVLDN